MAALKGDPRFVAMERGIETDNARMREQLLSQRSGMPGVAAW